MTVDSLAWPNTFVPFMSSAFTAVPELVLGCITFGCGGALVPDLPGEPMYDCLPRDFPGLNCGEVTVPILAADVAPAVADSLVLAASRFNNSDIFIAFSQTTV